MKNLQVRRAASWVVFFLMAVLAACATPARRGISLSDAQREAAKDDSEKKKVLVADEAKEDEEDQDDEDEPSSLEVGFAVADETPHLAVGCCLDAAMFEITNESRLINRGGLPERCLRWPYQAKVMKMLLKVSNEAVVKMVRILGFPFLSIFPAIRGGPIS